MAGRISALDEKLAALGQTQEDYLPSEIEKFKDATSYEEFLDVDPQVIREAIENPDQSHVDEMLNFAEQANREYEAGGGAASGAHPGRPGRSARRCGPQGTFHVTDMSREQMEAVGYGSTMSPRTGSISSWPTAAAPLPSPAEPPPNIPHRRKQLSWWWSP